MALVVVRRVAQLDVAVAVERDAVLGVGQIFGRQPEVERVLRHQIEREPRRIGGAPADSATPSSLPTKEMCPIGYSKSVDAEVEVVDAERLLEHRRVRALRHGHQHRVDVPHVVPADHVGAVGEAARMLIVGATAAAAPPS